MSDVEWKDKDDPKLREVLGYALRSHVAYQDGRGREAPSLVFADADYERDDGTCGLHVDGKQANEPAIVYVRADALMDALDRAEAAEAERDEAREAVNRLGRAMGVVPGAAQCFGDVIEEAIKRTALRNEEGG